MITNAEIVLGRLTDQAGIYANQADFDQQVYMSELERLWENYVLTGIARQYVHKCAQIKNI